MKYLQIPVNASNLKNFPIFTPKGHPRVCWVILIILQLHRTVTENSRIDTINTFDRIDCINEYEDNRYNQSDQLTLQTLPTQWRHCCFIFWFAWLIKVSSIFCYNPVSSFWYGHLCFIFCLWLPLNPTVVPTAEVRLISQQGMGYWCVYHGHMFLPVFILLTEPSSCVSGAINCNKEDLTIMPSVTQDDDHQISDVLLSIW